MKGIQVHHAIPFRLTRDNSQANLFPLCVKHHKIVESIFVDIEDIQPDYAEALTAWRIMLSDRQWATRVKLLEIQHALAS